MNFVSELPKRFDHTEAERRLFAFWSEHRVFDGEVDPKRPPFCVVIPPPNITGILHMGHVLDNIPQDVMTRWHRMRGFAAVWVPGTDHASIATEHVVKRELAKEGLKKEDLGREQFLQRVWQWREKHGGIIIEQLKRMGCSCDWRRERFTMDEGLNRAVLAAFIKWHEQGLIYRGQRMINWCTVCGTALSNVEVEHPEVKSRLWHFRYPLVGDNGHAREGYVVVATTRPETMLGDTAVAVNPADERYRHLVGHHVLLPLQNRKIPIIADDFVDPAFGTGVVKVTPAHDPNDYNMGVKHNLPLEVVIGDDGCMTSAAGEAYAGLPRSEARQKVVADLEALGLLEQIDPYVHAVASCYRCHQAVEPLLSKQWFVAMSPLAEQAKQVVLEGKLKILPDSEKHDYLHWMDTLQDWCISRQLWWGHRIPVYYCQDCEAELVALTAPADCSQCGSERLKQDEDVLDTWFSSQLWPFSTLGWPERTPELDFWYPNSWLMSGRDILPFWDIKMILAGLSFMGEVPFRTLALHGMVRDKQGRKVSKSLGNSVDPLELIDKHGADAVRAAILYIYPMGRQDTRLGDELFNQGQALIIKLWNAFRLLLSNQPEAEGRKGAAADITDRWIQSRLSRAVSEHDRYLGQSDFNHAFETVAGFFWNEFCDWYLELIKPRLRGGDAGRSEAFASALLCARNILKLLHPYIPFVTEELWQELQKRGLGAAGDDVLALSRWPQVDEFVVDAAAEKGVAMLISLVRAVRDLRHHLNIAPKEELSAELLFFDDSAASGFAAIESSCRQLGRLAGLNVIAQAPTLPGLMPLRFEGGVAYVRLPAASDTGAIKKRLEAKITKLEKVYSDCEKRLAREDFVKNAPADLVAETRAKAAEYLEGLEKLRQFAQSLTVHDAN